MKTEKFQNKYRIPSARALWHDYNGGDYFITICTSERLHYFGEIYNGKMQLNELGRKLDELILNITTHNSYCVIPIYQIMPNHVHLIVCIDGRDVACRVSMNGFGNDNQNAGGHVHDETGGFCRDAACHVSTNGQGDDNQNAACHVSTNENETNGNHAVKNEKMQNIAEQCGLLSTTIGGLKSALTKFANLNKITFGWQTRFHDHIIRSQDEMNKIATYIENNVTTWENDKFFTK